MKNRTCGDYIRVTKTTAKRLIAQGKTVSFILCNMRPDNLFEGAVVFDPKEYSLDEFDKLTEQYLVSHVGYPAYYGSYLAYYIKKG